LETAVIIVAAGRGLRAGGEGSGVPKQYRQLGGVSVIAHSLETFTRYHGIDAVLPVIHADDRGRFETASADFKDRLMEAVPGGNSRQQSVLAGLKALRKASPRNILIHDAARPFATATVAGRVITALENSPAAIPALPVADTLKRASEGRITGTLDRSGLWAAQTPQGFRFDAILEAHEAAARSGKTDFTDDASIAEWHGLEVALVEGDVRNMKLTTAEDFALAEQQIASGETRTGQGYDVHAFTEGNHVVLCGVRIEHGKSLAGHSDADVGLHAITDALLGAIGDGDIGQHFPPSDPQWRGASSDIFLKDAARRISERGGRIVNIDVTLICEAPKVGPHGQIMRQRIADILGIETGRVGVKATTTEGLGFTGRREGIAAMASASVRLP
jgi:2-C-methyl-D-erythritol 4-phosphate cytidylyltransferase / 2-C-methyl-D-erythritol 2,4-cyclodiphosphate synthase